MLIGKVYDELNEQIQDLKRDVASIEGGGGGGGTTVVANPEGEATDDLEKLKVGNVIYDIPDSGTTVVANPEGEATNDLEKIQVGEVIYDIPSGGGGGGTTVVANPSGAATQDLNKLQVGNVVYDTLDAYNMTEADYADLASPNPDKVYCLSDRFPKDTEDIDIDVSDVTWTAVGDQWTGIAEVPIDPDYELHGAVKNDTHIVSASFTEMSGDDAFINIVLNTDPAQLTTVGVTLVYVNNPGHTRIMKNGIPFGAVCDVLYSTATSTASTDLELNGYLSDYDFIFAGFYYSGGSGNAYNTGTLVPVDVISDDNDHTGFDNSFYQVGGRGDRWVQLKYKDDETLTLVAIASTTVLNRIYGVRFN